MKAVLGVLLAVSVFGVSAGEVAKPTPEAALKQAESNQKLAQELWTKNTEACLAGDTSVLAAIMKKVSNTLHEQPLTAFTLYGSCRQLLLDVSFINGACFTGKLTAHEVAKAEGNWANDRAACASEVANPDLQVGSDRVQTEAEWEVEQRKAGVSEEDIQFMKEIRSK